MITQEGVPADPDWVRWILGLWIMVTLGVFVHLYAKVERVRDQWAATSSGELKEIWSELKALRTGIEDDRRRAADARAELASSIVTRDEMERQVNRLVDIVDRQIGALAVRAKA
jgi:hypothetical protein